MKRLAPNTHATLIVTQAFQSETLKPAYAAGRFQLCVFGHDNHTGWRIRYPAAHERELIKSRIGYSRAQA